MFGGIPMVTIIIYALVIILFAVIVLRSPCEGNLIPELLNQPLIVECGGDLKISQALQGEKYELGNLTLILDDANKQLLVIESHLVRAINYSDIVSVRMNTLTYFKNTVPSVIYLDLSSERVPSFGIQLSNKLSLWEMLTSQDKRQYLWTVYNAIDELLKVDCEDSQLKSTVYMR